MNALILAAALTLHGQCDGATCRTPVRTVVKTPAAVAVKVIKAQPVRKVVRRNVCRVRRAAQWIVRGRTCR